MLVRACRSRQSASPGTAESISRDLKLDVVHGLF
jgi:hypothetical protein